MRFTLANILKKVYQINEATEDEKVNKIQDLITILNGYQEEDLSDESYARVKHILGVNEGEIEKVLSAFNEIGISQKTNPDVYEILHDILKYQGGEKGAWGVIKDFMATRNENGLTREDLNAGHQISIIELAKEKLGGNEWLVKKLANITGATKSIARGKLEVLLGIISRGGNIVAQLQSEAGKGDVIVDGEAIEVKCSIAQGKGFTASGLQASGGKLGSKGEDGLKDVGAVLKGIHEILQKYYNTLPKGENDPMSKLPQATKGSKKDAVANVGSFSLNDYSKGFIDKFILSEIPSDISPQDAPKYTQLVHDVYKAIFKNFFSGDSANFMNNYIDKGMDKFLNGRTIDKMVQEGRIIAENQYVLFQEFIGCLYLQNYRRMENFKGMIISSIAQSGDTMQDRSIYLSGAMLEANPESMAQAIHGSGLKFVWPRLDLSANRSIVMSVYMLGH